jgi:hypothetical protein
MIGYDQIYAYRRRQIAMVQVIFMACCALIAVLLVSMLSGCCWICPSCKWLGGCPTGCYWAWGYNYTKYDFKSTSTTPKGIKVDGSQAKIVDLVKVENRFDAIETCLKPLLEKYKNLTEKQRSDWGCGPREYKDAWIKRSCVKVKLIEPVSGCFDWDLLPDLAPEVACTSKGLKPTDKCPCRWREVVQGDNILITTSTQMPMWDLVTIVTECSKPWNSPFAKCMGPGIAY